MRASHVTTAMALLALVLVLGVTSPAGAETALGSSAWSLEIGTNVAAANSDASFAIRRHSGATSAFRFGVELSLSDFDGNGTRTTTGSPDIDVAQFSQGNSHAITLHYMRFAPVRNNVTATFAVGPVVERSREGFRVETAPGQPTFNGSEFRQTATRFGLDILLGVEWFFNPRFSLGGNGGLRATAGSTEAVTINRTGTGPTYSVTEQNMDFDVTQITTSVGRIQLTGYF